MLHFHTIFIENITSPVRKWRIGKIAISVEPAVSYENIGK